MNTSIGEDASYKDLISLLGYLVNLSKNAVSYGSYSPMKQDIGSDNASIHIAFNPGTIDAMEASYTSAQ